MTSIPKTREEAIQALVNHDVSRWGEAERIPSTKMHQGRTYGLALNALANRAETDGLSEAAALRDAATKALTKGDWAVLRKGG